MVDTLLSKDYVCVLINLIGTKDKTKENKMSWQKQF